MIDFLCGKPGGGKSLFALQFVVLPELLRSNRYIITNLSINREALAAWLHDQHDDTCDLLHRLVIITDEQVKHFWEIRDHGPGRWPIDEANDKWEYTAHHAQTSHPGVLYVLDEVHIAFGARNWQKHGKSVLFYLSQHRKVSDDVVLITQSAQNVDKQFRSVAQSYTYLKNLGMIRAAGFRLPERFIGTRFSQPAGPGVPVEATKVFKLHPQIKTLYDTSAGVGIVGGRMADKALKREGIHWAWFIVGTILIAVVFRVMAVNGSGFVVGKLLGKREVPTVAQPETNTILHAQAQFPDVLPSQVSIPSKSETSSVQAPRQTALEEITWQSPVNEKPVDVVISGITTFNGLRVYLSNGDYLDLTKPGIEAVMREGVRYKGRVYRPGKALPLELVE